MDRNRLSADDAIALMSGASGRVLSAKSPVELLEVVSTAVQQAHLAQTVSLSAPFDAAGAADATGLRYSIREGVWTREIRLTAPARTCSQSRQIARFVLELAQARLQTLLQVSTLTADLAHLQTDHRSEDAESGLRRGLVRSLEWAIERAVDQSTGVGVFQVEWIEDASEPERLELTALLRANLRKVDQVVRLNPERTVVLLEGLAQPDSVARVEERLVQQLQAQSVGFWSGVALYPCHSRTPERLLGLSERALHEARVLGHRGFYHYGTMLPEAWRNLA